MKDSATRLLADESGVSAIEYALIAAGMAVIVIAMMSTLAGGLTGLFQAIAGKMTIQ